jgi:hypothetical protein
LRQYLFGDDALWNWFDLVLAIFAIVSALPEKYRIGANLTFLRILRVARLVRLVRLFTIFKPLTVLFLALIDGLKTLLWAAVLLLILLLLFALVIVFLDESKGHLRGSDIGRVISPSLLTLMFSLFECMTEGCTGSLIRPLVAETGDRNIFFVYSIFVVISVFAVMNLFTAMFVENTMAAAKVNSDRIRRDKDRQSKFMAKKLQDLARAAAPGSTPRNTKSWGSKIINSISRESFNKAINEPEGRKILDDLEIPEGDREELFGVLDADGSNELDVEELIHGIIKVRGQARSMDTVAVRLMVEELRTNFSALSDDMKKMKKDLTEIKNAQGLESSPNADVDRTPASGLHFELSTALRSNVVPGEVPGTAEPDRASDMNFAGAAPALTRDQRAKRRAELEAQLAALASLDDDA